MTSDILKVRERAFEYEFSHKIDQQLIARLREKLKAEKRQRALSESTGIEDQSVLRELDELKIGSECVLALSLYPLVHVAWSDGDVDARERIAVLDAAEQTMHDRDSISFHLLESWLEHQPSEQLLTAWKDYLHAIVQPLTPVARRALKYSLLTRARRVAEAAGGFMGVHKTSASEEAALADLEAAFTETHDNPGVMSNG